MYLVAVGEKHTAVFAYLCTMDGSEHRFSRSPGQQYSQIYSSIVSSTAKYSSGPVASALVYIVGTFSGLVSHALVS